MKYFLNKNSKNKIIKTQKIYNSMVWYQSVFKLNKIFSLISFRFILSHWYLFIIIFSILPTVVSSIQVAYQTNNPAHPFFELGLSLTNADSQVNEITNTLRTNPEEFVGIKPEIGAWKHILYYWKWVILWWEIIGLIFLISIPFTIAYKYFKWRGSRGFESSLSHNITSALITGIIFIFFINALLLILGLVDGDISLKISEGLSIEKKLLAILVYLLPFHGVINLILYLAGTGFPSFMQRS